MPTEVNEDSSARSRWRAAVPEDRLCRHQPTTASGESQARPGNGGNEFSNPPQKEKKKRRVFPNPLGGLGLRPFETVVLITELAASSFAVELPVDFDAVAIPPAIPGSGFSTQGL